mgnify:CR=1 FL=1
MYSMAGKKRYLWVLPGVLLWFASCGGSGAVDEQDASLETLPDGVEVADASYEDAALEDVGPTYAPDFALTDLNPGSPTYGEERRLADETGKVLIIYFASYT